MKTHFDRRAAWREISAEEQALLSRLALWAHLGVMALLVAAGGAATLVEGSPSPAWSFAAIVGGVVAAVYAWSRASTMADASGAATDARTQVDSGDPHYA